MPRDELREKLTHMIGYEDWGDKTAEDVADDILSLLDAQRCVWTRNKDGNFQTDISSCDGIIDSDRWDRDWLRCPYCGREVEVKDA